MKITPKLLSLTTASCFTLGSAQAATIVEWDIINTSSTATTIAVGSTSTDVSATGITTVFNGGTDPSRDTADFASAGDFMFTNWTDNASAVNDYLEWSATNNTGNIINLEAFDVRVDLQSNSVDNTAEAKAVDFRVSTDGFGTSNIVISEGDRASNGGILSYSLSSLPIASWSDGETITFRWAAFGGPNDTRHAGFRGTTLPTLTGTVVPEPSATLLAGLSGLLLIVRRRR